MEQDLKLEYQLHTIFLVSEGYTNKDIQKIRTFFNCEVVSFYGHSERILFLEAITPEVDIYQIDKRYGFFELVDDDKHQIIENNISGTIVGTTFDNYAMPLIRYETDDVTQYLDYKTGTISMVDSLRNQVYLDGKDGIKISVTSFNLSPFTYLAVIPRTSGKNGHIDRSKKRFYTRGQRQNLILCTYINRRYFRV